MRKTFLSKDGESIGNPGEDHADIARAYLASAGVAVRDYLALYTEMFARGFARVTQEGNQLHIERPGGFSGAQEAVIEAHVRAQIKVFANDGRYTESK